MYVEPEKLVNLFVGCGLDFGMKFVYNGFGCECGVLICRVREVFGVFPNIVVVGLCIEYDYEYVYNNCYEDKYQYNNGNFYGVFLGVDDLIGKIGFVVRGLRHLRIVGGGSGGIYGKLFDSSILMMWPNIKTLVLDDLRLRGLDGMLFCGGMRKVEMIGCEWRETDITCFSKLMMLTVVKFYGCCITNSDARTLMECGNLRKLEINNVWPINVPFTFKNLVYLKIRGGAYHLNMMKYRVLNFGEISACRKLRTLNLNGNEFVVDCELVKYPLCRLWLKGCELINVSKLNGLTFSRKLDVVRIRVSRNGFRLEG